MTISRWPNAIHDQQIKPYFKERHELTVEQNCLLLGNKVVVPKALRNRILELFHEQHLSIVRTKMLRSYCWWPGLNDDVEKFISSCEVCQQIQNFKSTNLLRSWPPTPNNFFLDSRSKWLKVKPTKNGIKAKETILKLKEIFSIFGLLVEFVSDNSAEFYAFCQLNGIKPIKTPPYYLQSNGMAKREKFSINSTGLSPAEDILKNRPRTRFDLLKPDIYQTCKPTRLSTNSLKLYNVNELVYVKNAQTRLWNKEKIVKVCSHFTYLILIKNEVKFVHADSIRPRYNDVTYGRLTSSSNLNSKEDKGDKVVQDNINSPTKNVTTVVTIPTSVAAPENNNQCLTQTSVVTRSGRASKPPARLDLYYSLNK
ncbi:hypothetical protein ILUMI_17204 [Ignelater luminosus]|uniref:RNA-directed DNA polymerase n=1 Tax=Ignelater luminosus TaxID=2038154 RepID=A0A8K0CKA5_IGNLU|nr:hypothetical protein ILUMI_17204 [Ignelater luminosus]